MSAVCWQCEGSGVDPRWGTDERGAAIPCPTCDGMGVPERIVKALLIATALDTLAEGAA